jgi:hypothetical protein
MNLTWSHMIDYFQTPENMLNSLENQKYFYTSQNYYEEVSDWLNYQKYQAIGNYPDIYNTLLSYNTVFNIISLIAIFWLIDNCVIKRFFKKARWFILHTIANAFVVSYVWSDFFNLLKNPLVSFNRTPRYEGLNMTVALHFYHAIFFKNLPMIDWIHHILMISIAIISYFCPPAVIVSANGLLFFLNGLPGGLDYLLLTLVKYDVITPIKEKELNSYLNVWIRSPGVIIGTYNMYLTTIYTNYNPYVITKSIIMCILIWNAQYFTYRVMGNYFTKLTKKHVDFEKREGRNMSTTEFNDCMESDEILSEKDVADELRENNNLNRLI